MFYVPFFKLKCYKKIINSLIKDVNDYINNKFNRTDYYKVIKLFKDPDDVLDIF